MPPAIPPVDDKLRRRIEDHLRRLGCGLRTRADLFEVFDLETITVIVTFADLTHFAQTNGISFDDRKPA